MQITGLLIDVGRKQGAGRRLPRGITLFFGIAAVLLVAGAVDAAPLTYIPSDSGVTDVEHTMYRWRITKAGIVTPSGSPVTGAALFVDDLFRADVEPDRLFVYLLDTARTGGMGLNALATDRRGMASIPTAARASATRSFTARPASYSYDFDRAQTLKLSEYLASGGDVATALDPDCPFFDERAALASVSQAMPVTPPASVSRAALDLRASLARRRRGVRRARTRAT